MKFKDSKLIKEFLNVVDEAHGAVFLKSVYGDCYNLKSELSKYIAIAALLQDHEQALELFCEYQPDEELFFRFFNEHPEVLRWES